MESYKITDLHIGQKKEKEFYVSEEMGRKFAEVCGDFNPVHFDDAFAEKTVFGKKIVHGMLVGSFISGVIGNEFPGNGSIYMKQELKFVKPVYYGDKVRVCVEVSEIDTVKSRVELHTDCYNQLDEMVISGVALVMMK